LLEAAFIAAAHAYEMLAARVLERRSTDRLCARTPAVRRSFQMGI
jgi:hypothetical protein